MLPSPLGSAIELPDLFAQEQSLSTSSIEEALAVCATDFRYDRSEINLAQVILDDELVLYLASESFHLTQKALDDLCAMLKIPLSFARTIPTELLALLVAGLKRRQTEAAILIHREDVVVGVIDPSKGHHKSPAKIHRPHYEAVSAADVLGVLQDVRPDEQLQPPRITLSDAGYRIELLSAGSSIEPIVGDITRVGVVITGSETGGPLPLARGHTLRLICTNGATMPEQFGVVRFSSDWRVGFERRLTSFAAGLRTLGFELDWLREAYANLVDNRLTDYAVYNLYRNLRYLYRHAADGEALADRALGVEREQRLEIVGPLRRRQNEIRQVTRAELDPPRLTELLSWEVFNNLTATAREETYQRRVGLERLAGQMLGPSPRRRAS